MMLTLLQNLGENCCLNKVALWKNIYANIYIAYIYIFMLLFREKETHQLAGGKHGRQ